MDSPRAAARAARALDPPLLEYNPPNTIHLHLPIPYHMSIQTPPKIEHAFLYTEVSIVKIYLTQNEMDIISSSEESKLSKSNLFKCSSTVVKLTCYIEVADI